MPKPISSVPSSMQGSISMQVQSPASGEKAQQVFAQKPPLPTEPLKLLQNRKITYLKGIGLGLLGIIGTVGGVALIAISGGTALLVVGGVTAVAGGAIATYKSGKQLEMVRGDEKIQHDSQTARGFCKVNAPFFCQRESFEVSPITNSWEEMREQLAQDFSRRFTIECNGKEYPTAEEHKTMRLGSDQEKRKISESVADRLYQELCKKYPEPQVRNTIGLAYQSGLAVFSEALSKKVENQNGHYQTDYKLKDTRALPTLSKATIDISGEDPIIHLKTLNSFSICDPSDQDRAQLFELKEGSIHVGKERIQVTTEYEYKGSVQAKAKELFLTEGEKFFSAIDVQKDLAQSISLVTESPSSSQAIGSVKFEREVYTSTEDLRQALANKLSSQKEVDAIINSCQIIESQAATANQDLQESLKNNYAALVRKMNLTESEKHKYEICSAQSLRKTSPTTIEMGGNNDIRVRREGEKYYLREKDPPQKAVSSLIQSAQQHRILENGKVTTTHEFDWMPQRLEDLFLS